MKNHRGKQIGCVIACALIAVSSCRRQPGSAPAHKAFDYRQHVGVALVRPNGGSCLAIHNASINPGERVTLVEQPDVNQPAERNNLMEANVVERLSQQCDDHMDFGEAEGPVYYRIRLAGDKEPTTSFFIAIVDAAGRITRNAGKIDADIDGDGKKETFRRCSSAEGVHYQIWSGEALKGTPRWHWYIEAGYDTEPTCTDNEYFGPKVN